jgi:hypothetical protein
MPDKYEVEDVIRSELRKMPGFLSNDPSDGGTLWFDGKIDVGRIAERLMTDVEWSTGRR